MNPIATWLARWRQREAATSFLVAALASVGAVLVLAVTFWFTYAVVYLGGEAVSAVLRLATDRELVLPHEWRLVISGVFLVLLFIGYARSRPEETSEYPKRDYAPFLGESGFSGGIATLLAYPGASSKMITDLLFSGPKLTFAAWSLFRRGLKLMSLDLAGCSQVLTFLVERGESVRNEELARLLPGHRLLPVMDQLRLVPGVVFLELGVSLDDGLRRELLAQFDGAQMNYGPA